MVHELTSIPIEAPAAPFKEGVKVEVLDRNHKQAQLLKKEDIE